MASERAGGARAGRGQGLTRGREFVFLDGCGARPPVNGFLPAGAQLVTVACEPCEPTASKRSHEKAFFGNGLWAL